METIWRDIRYTIRSLVKNPGLMTVAILTPGVGTGATTAVFSVVNQDHNRPRNDRRCFSCTRGRRPCSVLSPHAAGDASRPDGGVAV